MPLDHAIAGQFGKPGQRNDRPLAPRQRLSIGPRLRFRPVIGNNRHARQIGQRLRLKLPHDLNRGTTGGGGNRRLRGRVGAKAQDGAARMAGQAVDSPVGPGSSVV